MPAAIICLDSEFVLKIAVIGFGKKSNIII
jgi:hypothetical protein